MKKENTILVILGGVAVLGLSYFLYRRFTKKGEQKAGREGGNVEKTKEKKALDTEGTQNVGRKISI